VGAMPGRAIQLGGNSEKYFKGDDSNEMVNGITLSETRGERGTRDLKRFVRAMGEEASHPERSEITNISRIRLKRRRGYQGKGIEIGHYSKREKPRRITKICTATKAALGDCKP